MKFLRPTAACLILASGVISPTLGFAQPAPIQGSAPPPTPEQVAEGRLHFERGVSLFDQANFDGALVEFQRAWELSQRPSVLFNVAAACQALHRYADAIDALDRYVAAVPTQDRQRRQAERTAQELRALIAWVQIVVDPPDAVAMLDERTTALGVEVMVGPGTHRVEVSRAGRHPGRAEFTIASGEHRVARFTLQDAGGSAQSSVVISDPTREPIAPIQRPPQASAASSLDLQGAPSDAIVLVDGAPQSSRGPRPLTAGPHRIQVTARGMRPWTGTVTLRQGAQHRLALALAPERAGISAGWFWGTTAATGAFLLVTVATGVAALDTHSEYANAPAGSLRLASLESRGRALGIVADVFGIATLGVGAAAIYLFTRTNFNQRPSTVTFSLGPLPGGAAFAVGASF